jgi:probable F420-dependent oxidoreductase
MQLGAMIFTTDQSIRPDRLAVELEDRGLDALVLAEHTHIPVSRRTPYPGGEPLPEEYKRTYDPFVALTAAAVVTTRLRLVTGICLVAQHDTIDLAKQVASLDTLSGGRVTFGIGFGWNVDEMEQHGVDPGQRRRLVREKVLAMQRLWADEVAEFHGELVNLEPSWCWPKPVQQPRPPILIGGAAGPTLFRHVVEYADGWMPIGGHGLRQRIPELHRLAEEAGRDPAGLRILVTGAQPEAGRLEHYASLGVECVALPLPPAPADVVLPILDRYAELVKALA